MIVTTVLNVLQFYNVENSVMTVVVLVKVSKLSDEPHQAHFHKPVYEDAAHPWMHVRLHDAHVTRKRPPPPLHGIDQTPEHGQAMMFCAVATF